MHLTVALTPRNPVALNNYATAVGNPASPDYRRYLTPAQFRARFAPARRTIVKVETSLRRHGLRTGLVSANGLSIGVTASGASVEHAFKLTLASVRLRNGRDAIFSAQAPAVDADIASSVQAVVGLSSLARMQRLDASHAVGSARARSSSVHVATGGPQACLSARQIALGQGAYTADQIATAYGFSGVYRSGDLGRGVTIGVYELEPNSPRDIAAYQRCYRTDTRVRYVKVDGGAGTGNGEGEAALDIEQLIGLAPKAKLIVYQGPNNNADSPGTGPYDTLAAIVSQDRAQVISNSWGECEVLEGPTDARAENTLLQEAATQGQTFVSASGDSGSQDCYSPPPGGNINNSLQVDDPGSQPFATAVGGTSLSVIGPPPTETVWNDDNPDIDYSRFGIERGAGGGGVSALWGMPSYQSSASTTLGVINADSSGAPCAAAPGAYCREIPDVSADADPMSSYLDYWNGDAATSHSESGWQGTGGTSGAAPVWAALFALADASPACRGSLVGFANNALYELAGESQSTYFNDISGGNNDFTPDGNTSGLYPATSGYDMATGLGTPKAATLVPALCRQAVQIHYPGAVYSFYHQHLRIRVTAKLAIAGQSGLIEFRASRLPVGLHINSRTGVISGRVRRPGVRTVTITASTPSGAHGAVQFNWSVERRPQVSTRVAGQAAQTAVSMTLRSGAYEPGLREVQITLPRRVALRGSAGAVQVLNRAGRELVHQTRLRGRVLTIELKLPHPSVRLVFAPGALRRQGPTSDVAAVKLVDRAGGRLTLRRTLHGV
jgi:subtilase family serine protease